MQASAQKAKGELIAEIKGKTHSWTIKEVTQSGVKMELNDEGQITGKYNANFMETTTINMKPDGTSTWEGRGIQNAGAIWSLSPAREPHARPAPPPLPGKEN